MSVGAEDADWQRHQNFAIRFYELPEAQRLWRAYVRAIVLRPNSANGGRLHRDDPTILAWQLANEPRALSKRGAYRAWVSDAAGFLKGLDCNHMVTVGSEELSPYSRSRSRGRSRSRSCIA
jgi:mannan endo-1,4-beta-mannosidase